jgi:putative redox protein
MELLLVALGGCTAMDVISILRKKRESVTGYTIQVSGTPAETIPHVFTSMTIHHVIEGNDVSDASVQRAIELSETKYCSAFAMLSASAPITSSYEITSEEPVD